MDVTLAGSGPAAEAALAGLSDVDATVSAGPAGIADADLAVVVAPAGDDALRDANERAADGDTPWIAVELGGVGGRPVVEAAVAGLAPDGPCYRCLAGRVAANADDDPGPVDPPDGPTARFAGAVAARVAADHLAGEDAVGRLIEPRYRERPLLALPNCECGTGRTTTVERGHRTLDLDATVARAERALDERVGPVAEVGEAESFPVPYYLATGCDTGGFSDAVASRQAAGVAAGWDRALMRALGEALERYAAGVYTAADTESAPVDRDGAVGPSAFVAPDGTAPTGSIEWIEGTDLATGEPVALPADVVVHPPREPTVRPPLTTGLGLGVSVDGALHAGLTEVIERDAAMLAWYSTYDPLKLAVADDEFETLAARARSEDLSVTALLLTGDVDVPVVAAAVRREEWPRIAFGSAASLDPERAARKALAEALQNWTELRGMGSDGADDAGGAVAEYARNPGAAAAWLDADGPIPADSVGPDDPPVGGAATDALIDRVRGAGMEPHAVRLTTRDLERVGFEVVRVVVPSAQPLFLREPFFGERAERVPRDLGFGPRPDRGFHPFP